MLQLLTILFCLEKWLQPNTHQGMEFGHAMEKFAGLGIHSGSRNEKPQKIVTKISPIASKKCPISSQTKSLRLQTQSILKPTRPQPFGFHTQERSTLSPKQVKVKDGEQNLKQEVVKKTNSTLERSFLRAAIARKSQQLKDKEQPKSTRVAKIEPENSVVEKEGIQGEDEVKKANIATRVETDEEAKMAAAKVFSALSERVESMSQMLEKEGDDADIEFGEEVKKTYRAIGGEIYEKAEVAIGSKVSSALIDRVESMPQKPRKETDDADTKIGEEEVKKAYRAAREETDEKAEMSATNKVSSTLIDGVESMLQKPKKEAAAAAIEIGDRL